MPEPFAGYAVETHEAGVAYYVFVVMYTMAAFALVIPAVQFIKTRIPPEPPETAEAPANETGDRQIDEEADMIEVGHGENADDTTTEQNSSTRLSSTLASSEKKQIRTSSSRKGSASRSTKTKELDRGESTTIKELSIPTKKSLAAMEAQEKGIEMPVGDQVSRISGAGSRKRKSRETPKDGITVMSAAASSGLPSAATTSRLHGNKFAAPHVPLQIEASTRIWDVSSRRWKIRRPIGRVDTIHNAIKHELESSAGISSLGTDLRSLASMNKNKGRRGMSHVASNILDEEQQQHPPNHFNPSMFSRNASFLAQHHQQFPPHGVVRRPSRAGSFSTLTGSEYSGRSALPPIVDDITPNDAADANDPGQGNVFQGVEQAPYVEKSKNPYGFEKWKCMAPLINTVLSLTDPTEEVLRVLRISLPLRVGAISEPLFRIIMIAFISNYLGTYQMVAVSLVLLFGRLTCEEISGAIIDALSSFLQQILYSGEPTAGYMAGQYIQLALLLQLLLCGPIVVVWYFFMENVVEWLTQSADIGNLARDYAQVILFHYLIQGMSRTCTVVFHVCGHEHFDSVMDFMGQVTTVVTVSCVVALVEHVGVLEVAEIQLFIGFGTAVAKVVYPTVRGWSRPFQKGMYRSLAVWSNPQGLWLLFVATLPLLVGSLLEFGEWELLTLFLRYSGSAEVSAWALLGHLWDILMASTEGIGEAAAIRIAFLLSESRPQEAKNLAARCIYWATVESLVWTSALWMAGKSLIIVLTTDPTLQHLMDEVFALLGLANVTMGFAQICWSLLGAQGRFRIATGIMFGCRWLVAMPVALICIFGFRLDLASVAGSLVVGYASASAGLWFCVLQSDWKQLSETLQEQLQQHSSSVGGVEGEGSVDILDFLDDDDDSSSSSSSSSNSSHAGSQSAQSTNREHGD